MADLTFKPTVNPVSIALAENYRKKLGKEMENSHLGVMEVLTQPTNKDQKLEEFRKVLEEQEMKECSFHP
jgi:hypothetical protein